MNQQRTRNIRPWVSALVAFSLAVSITAAEVGNAPSGAALLGTFTNAPSADMLQPGTEPWRWWDEARLGIFICYGAESAGSTSLKEEYKGGFSDWKTNFRDPAKQKKVVDTWNPEKFDAKQIVANVRKIGGRYIVFTAIHHDGFANWDTAMHDFKSTKTRCGKNLCAELGAACKEAKMPLMWYLAPRGAYSGTPPEKLVDPQDPKRNADLVFQDRIIDELLRTYPETAGFWWDQGFDERQVSHAYYAAKYGRGDLIFVANGIHRRVGNTIRCFEKRTAGFNRNQRWEACRRYLNDWYWAGPTGSPDLHKFVSITVGLAGNDANSLVNLAIAPDGSFDANLEKAVEVCGAWMERYGVAIYGTRGGPRQRGMEGQPILDKERKERFNSTCKGKTLYLFVQDWAKQDRIEMPALPAKIVSYKTLSGGTGLVENDEKSLRVTRPKEGEDPNAVFTCFAIELDQEAFSIPPVFGLAVEQSVKGTKP